MNPERQLILNSAQINTRVARIAYQIWENNHDSPDIVLAGIYGQGHIFASQIALYLSKISDMKVLLIEIQVDKQALSQPIVSLTQGNFIDFKGKNIIIIDDVLNSGRTIAYTLSPFLAIEPRSIQVAVLIRRSHRSFPINAAYVGYGLATTFQEHIEVEFENSHQSGGVYLR